jgi:hypothetical protein
MILYEQNINHTYRRRLARCNQHARLQTYLPFLENKLFGTVSEAKMSNLYKGPSIDASYQVSVHLAEGFQRRSLKCEKITDDARQVMAKAHVYPQTVSLS